MILCTYKNISSVNIIIFAEAVYVHIYMQVKFGVVFQMYMHLF